MGAASHGFVKKAAAGTSSSMCGGHKGLATLLILSPQELTL